MTGEGADSAAREIGPDAVRAVDALGMWLAHRGTQVLERPTEKTLRALLTKARDMAREIGRPEVAERIKTLIADDA